MSRRIRALVILGGDDGAGGLAIAPPAAITVAASTLTAVVQGALSLSPAAGPAIAGSSRGPVVAGSLVLFAAAQGVAKSTAATVVIGGGLTILPAAALAVAGAGGAAMGGEPAPQNRARRRFFGGLMT